MKTLPISAGKNEIKNLVIEWNELLAQETGKIYGGIGFNFI